MNFNLNEFFKLIFDYKELSCANSCFNMSENEFKNILFASTENDSNSLKSENSDLADYAVEIKENKSLFSTLKKKIKNLFSPKPQIYRLGNGESLELDGSMPNKPFTGILNKFGATLASIVSKPKEIKEASKIKNEPEIYSNSPAVIDNKKQPVRQTNLLDEGRKTLETSEFIIPNNVEEVAKSTPSYVETTINNNGEMSFNDKKPESLPETQVTEENPFTKYNNGPVPPPPKPQIITQEDNDIER